MNLRIYLWKGAGVNMGAKLSQNRIAYLAAAGLVLSLAASSQAVTTITQLVPASVSGTNTQAVAIDGTTAYFLDSTPNQIIKVTNVGSGNTPSTLVSASAWTAANDGSSPGITGWYGSSVYNGSLYFAITSSDSIYRVNTTTGAVSTFLSNIDIALTTGTTTNLLSQYTVTSTGGVVFYEGTGKNVWIASSDGAISSYLTASQWQTYGTSLTGAFTFDSAGNFYFATNSGIYSKSATTGVISQVLSNSSYGNVTALKDILIAPDGNVYFQDNTTKNIWVFDLDNPSIVSVYVSKAELLASTGGTSVGANIGELVWLDGKLAWNIYVAGSYSGLYAVAVPEVASVSLLGLGAAALLQRRRRA